MKNISLLLLVLIGFTFAKYEHCELKEFTHKTQEIVKYQVTVKEPYLAKETKEVKREVCKKKKVTEEISVPKVTYENKEFTKDVKIRTPYEVDEPYITYVNEVKKVVVKEPYYQNVVKKNVVVRFKKRPTYVKGIKKTRCSRLTSKKIKTTVKKPTKVAVFDKKAGKTIEKIIYVEIPHYVTKIVRNYYDCYKPICKTVYKKYCVKEVVTKHVNEKKYLLKIKNIKKKVMKITTRKVTRYTESIGKKKYTKKVKVIKYVKEPVTRIVHTKDYVISKKEVNVVKYKEVKQDKYKIEIKKIPYKKKVCQPLLKRKCTVWGDPHYKTAFGKPFTSRNVIGDVLLAETPNIQIHGRVAQWKLDATFVNAVGLKIKGCDKKLFVRPDGLYIERNLTELDDFYDYLAKCNAEVFQKVKDKFITQYTFVYGNNEEEVVILVGGVDGGVEWIEFTEEQKAERRKQNLSQTWMEVAVVGFIKPVGACAGDEKQAEGIFYNTQFKKNLGINVDKKKCALAHISKAKVFCNNEFQGDKFAIDSCIFDECHKMGKAAEIAFEKENEKLKYDAQIYNARKAGNLKLVTELLRKKEELRQSHLGKVFVDVEKQTWKQ